MNHYFHDWKRRFGLVTLVTSLTLLCGWFRSQSIVDSMNIRTSKTTAQVFGSERCGLVWLSISDQDGGLITDHEITSQRIQGNGFVDVLQELDTTWSYRTAGFRFGTASGGFPAWGGSGGNGRGDGIELMLPIGASSLLLTFWIIPYWSLLVPMTFLSASLLLSPSRKLDRRAVTA